MAGYAVAGVFAAITLSTAVCGVIAYVLAVRDLPRGGATGRCAVPIWGSPSRSTTAFWFLVHVDGIYVNSQLPALATGGYGAIATLARPIVYFPAAVNNLFFPFLAASTRAAARRRVLRACWRRPSPSRCYAGRDVRRFPELLLTVTFGASYVNLADRLVAWSPRRSRRWPC